MCGGKGEPDDNGADNDNIKFQDNLPIGMTIMDFDTLTPSRYKNNNINIYFRLKRGNIFRQKACSTMKRLIDMSRKVVTPIEAEQ